MFKASTMTELLQQHRMAVVPPSRLVEGMDAEVEGVILSCLERDPGRRPRSALAVLAGLPGGDPLAEAVAAGHTPSPQLIAASGGTARLPGATAAALVGAILVGLGLVLWLEPGVKLITRVSLPRSAEVLASHAEQHITGLGFPTDAAHRVYGFDVYGEYLAEIAARSDATDELWESRLAAERPAVIDFWYRQAPSRLVAGNIKGRITWKDPPAISPGMVQVRLDPTGRLRELLAIPDAATRDVDDVQAPWAALFAAAGLDIAEFSAEVPARIPRSFADSRGAWSGTYPEPPHLPIRVEAAAFMGRPVAFHIGEALWPGERALERARGASPQTTWRFLARVALILCAIGLGFDSLRRRRGDPRGAFRFGLTMFLMVVAFTVLTGDHGSWGAVGALVLKGMSHGLAVGVEFSMYYFALEPHVRRIWPQSLIPWTRLMGGRFRDPLVGQTVLVGLVLGVVSALFTMAEVFLPRWAGEPERAPLMMHPSTIETLMGPGFAVGAFLELTVDSVRESMKVFMSLVLLKLVLGRPTLVALASAVIWTSVWSSASPGSTVGWMLSLSGTFAFAMAFTLVAIHFGLLALVVGFITFTLPTVISLGAVVGATVFGCAAALRPAR